MPHPTGKSAGDMTGKSDVRAGIVVTTARRHLPHPCRFINGVTPETATRAQ